MIRFYCQYSFGGFRTFRIYGTENEALAEQEVDKQNTLDFPAKCNLYFNYGGAKLIFRTIEKGSIMIALRDIPGIEKDTEGRPINCALQIVGDKEDMPMMRNILLAIIQDVEKFQTGFTEGFSLRNGLHYDGRFLADFVKNLDGKTLSAPGTELSNLASRKGPVYLFVPTSPLFKTDNKLAAKVIKELCLSSSNDDTQNLLINTISGPTLRDLAGKVIFEEENAKASTASSGLLNVDDTQTTGTVGNADGNKENFRIIDLERDLEAIQDEKCKIEVAKESLEQRVKEQAEALKRKDKIILGVTVGASVVIAALIVSLCLK